MGSRLVTEALSAARWCAVVDKRPLSNPAWRVLVVMAHRSMDNDGKTLPARTYARGWEWLAAEALGYVGYGPNSAGKKAIHRAIAELTERKLIRAEDTQPGGFTRYRILP